MTAYIPLPSTLVPGSIVWAYVRDSGGPSQERSIDQQKAEIKVYCHHHNLVLKMIFGDEACSGKTTSGRNQFNEMIDLSESEVIRPAGILIWNYARFARDLDDSQFYKATLRKRGIFIHSLTDPIPEGPYGKIAEVLLDIANEEKKRQASRDASRGLRQLVEKYGCVPGVPPRGFMRERVELGFRRDHTPRIAHRWIPDPEWIPRIQKAFQMRAAGFTLEEIQAPTQLFGTLNSYTTFWSKPLYRGILHYGDLVVENYCQAMIDEETWTRVQDITRRNKNRMHIKSTYAHPRRVRSSYMLSGLAKCARCDSLLYGQRSVQRNGNIIDSYRCTKGRHKEKCDLQRIPAKFFEEEILHAILECLRPYRYLEICARANDSFSVLLEEQGKQHKKLQDEISNVRTKIDNLTMAIASGGYSRSLLNHLSILEKQEVDLLTQIERLKTVNVRNPMSYSEDTLTSYAQQLSEKLKTGDLKILKRVLQALIYEILVDRQNKEVICQITMYAGAGNHQDKNYLHKMRITFPIRKTP